MEKKSLTVWTFIVVAILSVAVNAATGEKQSQQELKHQQEQLEEIEKYISQRRQEIEDFYRGRLVDLQLRAEVGVRMLEVADKAVYAPLAAQTEVAKTVLHISNYGYRTSRYREAKTERMLQLKGEHKSCRIKCSPRRLAVAQSRIAERKNDILRRFKWGVIEIEKQKRYALTVGLVELEKRLKENVFKAKPKVTHGVITGIVYAEENPSAIIDGRVVHEGDTIHGVKVVKIHKDKIEFVKNSKKWKQSVQETPEGYWK